jgi:uncharacterized protein YbjT (DUF2867 family)
LIRMAHPRWSSRVFFKDLSARIMDISYSDRCRWMRVLLIGATGFIGRHICAKLLNDGHQVVAAVRDVGVAQRRFPNLEAVSVDMNRMDDIVAWVLLFERYRRIDAVVNCAGILQSSRHQSASAIHDASPRALFDACRAAGVGKVIQISAISADEGAGTEYAVTKKSADDYLRSLDLNWVVLRPSLVYAQGTYGGTSVLRGLAGFPYGLPSVGCSKGQPEPLFQPIHADDLATVVARCLTDPSFDKTTLEPVGPDTMTARAFLILTRDWLDIPRASVLPVPYTLVRLAARVGDLLGAGPMRTTALDQMAYGNTSSRQDFAEKVGFHPRSVSEAMRSAPSHVQDRWHARLFSSDPL